MRNIMHDNFLNKHFRKCYRGLLKFLKEQKSSDIWSNLILDLVAKEVQLGRTGK